MSISLKLAIISSLFLILLLPGMTKILHLITFIIMTIPNNKYFLNLLNDILILFNRILFHFINIKVRIRH